ncbi:MAG: ABC transporter permease [Planctomycetota bacterium]
MLQLILARLIQLPLILLVVFGVTFTLVWLLPGNPLDRPDGRRPPPEVEQAMKARYNLDSPTNFLIGYARGAVVGDFGPSLEYRGRTVRSILAEGLPISASLGVAALAVALFLGTVAGVVGALRPGSPLDSASLGLTLLGISLPNFVTGTVLLVVFAGLLRWFPVGGWASPRDMVLPAVTLGLAPAAYIARLIRLGLADIMASDYLRTARAKGLSHTKALFKHALKVAYLPVLSFLGPAAASVMTGSFVVEKVFNIPGVGEYFVNSVLNKDQFLILGIVLVYATMLIVFNLVVDVAYAWLDPRIEL